MLKRARVLLAIAVLTVITFYFIDFTGLLSDQVRWLAKIQLIPALLALNIGVILFLSVLTLLFGRVYCSVVCPMGIFQDVVSRISLSASKKKRKKGFRYGKPRNILRYSVLGLSIVSLIAGFALIPALIEPYSAYGRMATHLFKPVYMAGNNLLASLTASGGEYWFNRIDVLVQSAAALAVAVLTLLIIGFLAWRYGRIYCNTICPAGTLLGLLGRHSLFKVRMNKDLCVSCGACERKCKAMCIDAKGKTIDYSRCVECYNCLGSCKYGGFSYSLPAKKQKTGGASLWKTKGPEHPDNALPDENTASPGKESGESRRRFLLTAAATTLLVPKTFAQRRRRKAATLLGDQKEYRKQYALSPPGSGGHKHLSQHCTSCHLCINRCPTRILKPSLLEYGLGGIMQPVMSYENNFCEFTCTVCSDVCPNGAIKPLTLEIKQRTQVGYAVFVPENCIVNTQNISCGKCARKCPVSAIDLVPAENGFKVPSVNTDKCIGCGACEYICPVQPYRGIYVEGKGIHQLTAR